MPARSVLGTFVRLGRQEEVELVRREPEFLSDPAPNREKQDSGYAGVGAVLVVEFRQELAQAQVRPPMSLGEVADPLVVLADHRVDVEVGRPRPADLLGKAASLVDVTHGKEAVVQVAADIRDAVALCDRRPSVEVQGGPVVPDHGQLLPGLRKQARGGDLVVVLGMRFLGPGHERGGRRPMLRRRLGVQLQVVDLVDAQRATHALTVATRCGLRGPLPALAADGRAGRIRGVLFCSTGKGSPERQWSGSQGPAWNGPVLAERTVGAGLAVHRRGAMQAGAVAGHSCEEWVTKNSPIPLIWVTRRRHGVRTGRRRRCRTSSTRRRNGPPPGRARLSRLAWRNPMSDTTADRAALKPTTVRTYDRVAAKESLEDYSLRYSPVAFRRWSPFVIA